MRHAGSDVLPFAASDARRRCRRPCHVRPLLLRDFLLTGDRKGLALARTRIGVGPLPVNRQTAPMTQPAIGAEINQPSSDEHTLEPQSQISISFTVLC